MLRLYIMLILAGLSVLVGTGDAMCVHHPHRSKAVYRQFLRLTGYPHGRPGFVVDHKDPLACGGLDTVENMQWQTIADAAAKDKWERRNCACGHKQ